MTLCSGIICLMNYIKDKMTNITDIVEDLLPLAKMRNDDLFMPLIFEYYELKDCGYSHNSIIEKMNKHYDNEHGG